MRVDRYATAERFLADAGAFLGAREAEHNLILGISSGLLREPDASDEPPYLAVVRDDDRIVAAAIRTPPYNLILSEVDDPAALPALAQDLRTTALPGVVGPPGSVAAFSDAWTALAGGSWGVVINERMYCLTRVVRPRPVEGGARLATAADRPTIERWLMEFGAEALDDADAERVVRKLDDWQRGGSRRYWLWEVDGVAVAMVGAGGETPNGSRIGPVYTPVAERGRGFASNLTAHVSQLLLDEGRRFCFLYTNLANGTANRIYQAIGYEPVGDAVMVAFRSRDGYLGLDGWQA